MSDLIVSPLATVVSMSTREIASLCDKEHRNVVRDLKAIADQCDIDVLKFERIYTDSMNRQQTEYLLDRTTTLLLVSGYSAQLRLKIINRLEEMEKQIADPLANVRDEKTRAMIQNLIRIDTLEHEVKEQDKRIRALEGLEKDFVSIMGWCNVNHRDVDRIQAATMGRKASQRCRDLGVTPSRCNHPVFGEVNTYPVGLLDELFG